MEIIAHRGASRDAPENTLAALQLAWHQNADAVEVDVYLSRDGHIVVIHDGDTRKLAGVKKKVADQTLAELKQLDVGRWKGPAWAGEKIPTLDEALATIPKGKRFFIEIKCEAEFIPPFKKLLRQHEAKALQLVLIGFSLPTMAEVKKTFPKLEVCWIAEFKRNWKTGRWSPKPEELIQKATQAGLDGLDLGAKGPITANFVNQAKAAGLRVYTWTVDSPIKARKLFAAGVDGITTNRPAWLREKLTPV